MLPQAVSTRTLAGIPQISGQFPDFNHRIVFATSSSLRDHSKLLYVLHQTLPLVSSDRRKKLAGCRVTVCRTLPTAYFLCAVKLSLIRALSVFNPLLDWKCVGKQDECNWRIWTKAILAPQGVIVISKKNYACFNNQYFFRACLTNYCILCNLLFLCMQLDFNLCMSQLLILLLCLCSDGCLQ